MIPKTRKCRICKEPFLPFNTITPVCKAHEYEFAMQQVEKAARKKTIAYRKEHREAKERLKTRQDWLKDAQTAFNRWIRARDHGKPCISCGRFHGGQNHAGHYQSIGAHPELRFDENNCHLQCQPCNTQLSGNLIEYRKGLIDRRGVEIVEWLEGPHEPAKYSIDDLKALKAKFKIKYLSAYLKK